MSSFENSEELKVLMGLKSTSSLIIDVPVGVVKSLEIFLTIPLDVVGPCFSSSPVADEIFIS